MEIPEMALRPATKSAILEDAPSRRSVLGVLLGLALARPLILEAAATEVRRVDMVIRDGWVLRRDDLVRLDRA